MKDKIEQIGKLLPLITILLIILGIYNLTRFYSRFDIDILKYIDTTEILMSFSDIVNVLVLLSAFVLGLFLLLASLIGSTAKQSNPVVAINTHAVPPSEVKKNRIKSLIAFVILLACYIVLNIWTEGTPPSLIDAEVMYLFILGVMVLAFLITVSPFQYSAEGKVVSNLDNAYWQVWLCALPLVILHLDLRGGRIAKYILLNDTYEVRAYLNDGDSILTNNTLVFVSASQDYLFFRNRRDSSTTIIPKSDCKRIVIKNVMKQFYRRSKPQYPPRSRTPSSSTDSTKSH